MSKLAPKKKRKYHLHFYQKDAKETAFSYATMYASNNANNSFKKGILSSWLITHFITHSPLQFMLLC